MRRGSASIAANPVLIGAATTLVVIVAVFLAYNANSGLPFVPTYQLKVEVPSAASIVKGNEVRIGGTRVGAVEDIQASVGRDGRARAVLTMKLEEAVKPLPVDTTVLVRARSVLGLKYIQLTKGSSAQGLEDGATIPLRQARPEPVEFDEFLQTFDDPTRTAQQDTLIELGNGLAARGPDLNRLFESLPALLRDIQPVMRNLSDPETRLARLFQVLGRTAAELAPVTEQQASLFRNLDTTLQALADVSRPYLQEAIEEAPAVLDTATRELPRQRPFLRDSERLFAELRPGARALRTAAPPLADAIDAGAGTLERSPAFNRRLGTTFTTLRDLGTDPLAGVGLGDLTTISEIAAPLIGHIEPMQTTCNYLTLFFRNGSSLLSDGGSNGTWQRFIVIGAQSGPNSEGGAASAPANGGGDEGNFLHANPTPFTASPGQERENECESGNERYVVGRQAIGNPPGVQGTRTEATRSEVYRPGATR